MSYVAKGEKVFDWQDPINPDCTPPAKKRSDHRLKRFQSIFDKRAWDFCDDVRYRYLYDLMSGSRTCLSQCECHKYVPLEDLISILMAGKDELIRQLQEQLRQCCHAGDDPEKVALQNQIEELTKELNKSRDMLRQAMHKLQNIDEIVNENKKLQCRLRCSEERVRYLEEKRKNLECELADLRSKSQIQMDLEKAQKMLTTVIQQREEYTEMDETELQCLSYEKDNLQDKVKQLEKELEESKRKEIEIEMLKRQSHSDTLDKEEMSRENECYRKKLASMKCLERQIQELKKQGRALADKYRKEAQKANEQMNKMCQAAKELQCLREERDSLKKRVNELASYECQYNKLQRKLQKVDAIIAENENLNSKLCALQKLEEENEYLRCKLQAIQELEINAAEDKERIMQLQCAVADQEEEMKDLLCQIERLTSGRDEEELERLKCELYEKNSKLKLCEEQLAEIPMLEAEIDELRMKLQCCCREFPEKKKGEGSCQKVEVRLPCASKGVHANYRTPGEKTTSVIGIRREQKVECRDLKNSCHQILPGESSRGYKVTSECPGKKDVMSCEEVQNLLQSSKGIISCVLEDMIEHQKEMEELEMCNKAMKEEIEALKQKVASPDRDCLLQEIKELKKALEEREDEICNLKQILECSNQDKEDMETLRELNGQMKAELEAACEGLKQVVELEKILEAERKARHEAECLLQAEGVRRPKTSPGYSQSQPPPSQATRGVDIRPPPGTQRGIQSGVDFVTPSQVDTGTCGRIETATPSKVQMGTHGKVEIRTPSQAELGIRREMDIGYASKPEKGVEIRTPSQVDMGTSGRIETATPSKVQFGARGKVEIRTPSQAEMGIRSEYEPASSRGAAMEPRREVAMDRGGQEWEDCCKAFKKEANDLKLQIQALNKLTEELKKENELLRELQKPCPDFSKQLDEKCALENLLSLLQAELDAFKGQKLSDECEALRTELKRVMEQNCQLKALVDCYRQRLELEKKSNELNQIRLSEKEPEPSPGEIARESPRITPSGPEKDLEKSQPVTPLPVDQPAPTRSADEGKEVIQPAPATPGKSKAYADIGSEFDSCEDELKALKGRLSLMEKENDNLKTSLKDAETKLSLMGKPPGEAEQELLKELERLKKEKEAMAQMMQTTPEDAKRPKTADAGMRTLEEEKEDCMKELEALRKQKEALEKQLAQSPGKPAMADAGMKTLEEERADFLKELEALRREKEALANQLAASGGPQKPGTADAGMKTLEAEKDDCLKQLEALRREKEALANQLAASGGPQKPGTADAGMKTLEAEKDDCLKQLEALRKEKDALAKKLEEAQAAKPAAPAPSGMSDKERDDLLKQLEQLKKEKNELGQKLDAANQAAQAGTGAPAPAPAPAPAGPSANELALQKRLKEMEDECAEKLKKLMEQHEKELANREKAYNDNLNAMKAGYETDIRKMADRHKQSIMRLQGLHEDEVHELNLNHESQMDTMQTQSEAAINDVARGSAAKLRKIADQHTKEMKEKEGAYEKELSALRKSLTKSMQELESLRKEKKMRDGAKGDADQLKAQHARELQQVRRASKQKVKALKEKMEEEKRKSDAEVESLKQKLKDAEKGDGVCECKFAKKKPCKPRDPTCPLDFNEVLEKILEEGMDSLTFNEIALVHRKACCALQGFVLNSKKTPIELEPPVGDYCPHNPLLEADKQQLLSKIIALESEIQQRQRQTQDAIISMEVAIKKERCRLVEVRNLLTNEQEKNSKLQSLLSSQTKLQSDLKKERDKLGNEASKHQIMCEEKTKQLNEEIQSKKCLEAEIDQLKSKLKQLCVALDAERGKFDSKQKDQIELMRLKLEQSLHQEHRLALQLENEAKCRMQLQCQLQTLRQSFKQMVNLPEVECGVRVSQNPLEAKSAKEKQNLDQIKEKKNKTKAKSVKKQKK